jgi:hypothetical protein
MFAATDTAWAPWYVARTDDKQRGRLNIISHLLSQVPYTPLAPPAVTLPRRQRAGGYVDPELPLRYISNQSHGVSPSPPGPALRGVPAVSGWCGRRGAQCRPPAYAWITPFG